MFCGLSDTERLGDVVSLGAVKLWEDVGCFRLPSDCLHRVTVVQGPDLRFTTVGTGFF